MFIRISIISRVSVNLKLSDSELMCNGGMSCWKNWMGGLVIV